MRHGAWVAVLLVAGAASAGNIQGTLPADATWTTAGSPYTLTGDLTVPAGVTLTIQPGVQVIAAATDGVGSGADTEKVELIVRGTLTVLGTDASPVTFKGASPGTGFWRGVRVEAGTSTVSGALIRDAYQGVETTGTGTSVTVSSSTFTNNGTGAYVNTGTVAMDHSVAYANTFSGVQVGSGTADLQFNTFVANGGYGVAVLFDRANLTLRNSILAGNRAAGIYRSTYVTGWLALSHNDVWNNGSDGADNYSGDVSAGPNSVSANPLFVSSSNFRLTSRSPARKAASDGGLDMGALPYTGDATPFLAGTQYEDITLSGAQTLVGDLTVAVGVTLTVAPGTTLTAASSDVMKAGSDPTRVELIARGTLRVLGTNASLVTFKGASAWHGVRVEAGSTTSTVSGALIRDAYRGLETTGTGTSVTVSSCIFTKNTVGAYVGAGTLAMDHTLVHANVAYGVEAINGTADLQSNTFVSAGAYGVYLSGSTASLTLRNNILTGHTSAAVYRPSSSTGALAVSYNNAWNNGSGGAVNYEGSVSGGATGLSINPLFISSSNFRLTSRSPARKAASDGADLGALPYTGDATPFLAGTQHEDITLSGAQALVGDLTVPAGVTLTVAPGATLTAASSDLMQSGADSTTVELIVRGTLRVQGTSASPVTFKGSSTNSRAWLGVRVEAGSTTSTVSGALIRDAERGLELTGRNTLVTVSSSTLTSNSWGIYVSASTLVMDHTVVTANTSYGVKMANSGNANLQYNTFVSNGSYGVIGSSGGGLTLRNNIITGHTYAGVHRPDDASGALAHSNNDVWNNGSGGTTNYEGNISAGTGSFSSNPLFTSATDFHLQATSPCRRASSTGTDIGALPYDETVVASVEVVPGSATVDASGTISFMARAYNSEGTPITGAAFSWRAKAAAGTIDASGLLTAACAPGTITAAVTATSANGISGSANVTLIPGPVTQVAVVPTAAGVEAGATRVFTATVRDRCGNIRTGDSIAWSTATGAGAITVSGQYTTPCAPGSYTNAVTARVGSVSGTANVSVSVGALARLTLSPDSPSLPKRGQRAFTAVPADSCGNTRPDSVSWAVANGGGTITASGVFTAGTQPGFFADTIQALAGSKEARTGVTVLGGAIATVELTPASASVTAGGQVTFTATARDADGDPVSATPTWSVVGGGGTINSGGTFLAGIVAGTYANTVRVVVGGSTVTTTATATATATVTVQPGPADRVELSPSPATLAPGGAVRFTARVLDVHGNVRTDAVTWSLTQSGIGTLNTQTGDFTASTRAGTYTGAIRAEAGGRSATSTVIIQSGALSRLVLSPTTASPKVGESVAFTVRGLDEYGNEVDISPSWQVVAGGGSINASGLFTAGNTVGTYTDTVRVSAGGLSATASVTIKPGPATSVTLTPTNPSLPARDTVQFTARATDAFGNELASSPRTWTLLSSAAGTLTASGLFTAGNTAGSFVDAIQVEVEGVKAKTGVNITGRVTRVEVSSASASALPAGDSATFTARAFNASGAEVTDVTFTWSAKPAAGTIDTSGRLSVACTPGGVAAGVTATAEGSSGSVDVTVVAGPATQLVVAPASVTLEARSVRTFSASTRDKCGNTRPPASVTWSTASGAGTIDASGLYTAPCSLGTLSSAVVARLGSLSASASVTVTAGAPTTLTIDPPSATLSVTGSTLFSAKGSDACGNTTTPAASWSVVSGGGSVDGSGQFTAGLTAGTYADTLQASANGLTARASITVTAGPVASLAVDPPRVERLPGGTATFTARGADRFGNAVAVTPTWSVVAGGGSIQASGVFTAGSTAGTYPDTVRAEASGYVASATVVVLAGPVARVELSPTSITLAPGETRRFTARAVDTFGNPTDAPLTWSVASPQVGTISGNGSFTAGTLVGDHPEAVRVSAGGHTAAADVKILEGTVPDAGTNPDAGTGTSPDAGTGTDGGTQPGPQEPTPPGGCGCSSATDASAPLTALLLLALAMMRRRSTRA